MWRARHHPLTHPPTVLLLALLSQVAASFLPDPLPRSLEPVRVLGSVLILIGVAANVLAVRHFDRVGTTVSPGAAPRTLVTAGIFARTRNPMYLGLACILFGSALALQSLWAALPAVGFVIWIDRLIDHEESSLERQFGETYEAYRRRTPKWL